ncbi:MAG TPA: glycosyltransferase, partial [Trichococcus flocculiformis]|nr:glycosyltransferase [Trichococcus flocculiformis]
MKIVLSGGGTGGHIYPALALMNRIKEKYPDSEFLYVG